MLEADLSSEEEGNNLEEGGNPQLWIVRDAGNNNRSILLTQCTTLVQGGPSPWRRKWSPLERTTIQRARCEYLNILEARQYSRRQMWSQKVKGLIRIILRRELSILDEMWLKSKSFESKDWWLADLIEIDQFSNQTSTRAVFKRLWIHTVKYLLKPIDSRTF